jgi:hypothetical protein
LFLKKFYLLLFIFFLYKGYSRNPKIIDTLKIHNQIKVFGLDEKVLKFKSHFFSSIVFKNDSTLLYNPNGTFYLFEIHLGNNPKVYGLMLDDHSELNFNRYLFINNNILYSYGGEGKFNSFPWLIYFDFNLKKWIKSNIKNYPYDVKKILISWVIDNKLKVLLSHLSEDNEEIYSETKNRYTFGEIDLETLEYKEDFNFKSTFRDLLFISQFGFFRGNYVYESDLYSIHGYYLKNNEVEYRIFNKKKGVLSSTSKLSKIERVNGLSYLYIKDSLVYYKDKLGNRNSFNVKAGKIEIEKDFMAKYLSNVKSNFIYYVIVIIIVFLLIIKKRNKNSLKELIPDLQRIEKEIISYKNSKIDKDKLDELLGLSHYSYETIKKRRSIIIKQINNNGNVKIDRVRKMDDKRFYDYKIY